MGKEPGWTMPPTLESLLRGVAMLLWDFDGVIADTEPVQEASYRVVMAESGAVPEAGFFTMLLGKSEPEIWRSLRARYGLSATVEELMARRADVYLPRAMLTIKPNAFVRPVLGYCDNHGIRSMIVSSGGFMNISRLLAHWELTTQFSDVYCRASPYHPDLTTKQDRIRHAIDSNAGPAAIIEDSPAVLAMAREMGLRTIGVRSDFNHTSDLDADFMLEAGP
jgi:beta-phosphoglucomutase-like phosphatase (HAD superfamily)